MRDRREKEPAEHFSTAAPKWNDLRHDHVCPGQTRENIVEQRRKIARCRDRIASTKIIRADMEQDNIRLITLKPAIGVDTVLNLVDCPVGMAFVIRIRDKIGAALSGPREIKNVPVVCEQRPEQVPIAAIAGIGVTECDGIAERHDFDADFLG